MRGFTVLGLVLGAKYLINIKYFSNTFQILRYNLTLPARRVPDGCGQISACQ